MQLLFSGGDCLPLGEIADRVDDIFALCVQEVDDDPVYDPTEDRMRWEQNGERPSAIVEDLLGCGLLVAQAVVRVLQDKHAFAVHKDGDRDWYDDGASIYMKHFHASRDVAEKWTEFCSTLKHDARFLNQSAKTVLDEILKDAIEGKLPGLAAPIVSFGGPGTEERLFRARQADGLAAQKSILSAPAGQMGSPPPGLTSAGRMNAAGIGAFYAALDAKTCLAELRSPVGSSSIVVQFEALRPMRLLDLRQFDLIAEPELSPFLPDFFRTIGHIRFLKRFHQEIRKPILPQAAPIEYIPTQYIAEYLAQPDFGLDGILFHSTQVTDGINVVIFSRSAIIDTALDADFVKFDIEIRPDSPRDEEDLERRLELTRTAESAEARAAAIAAQAAAERDPFPVWRPEPVPAPVPATLRIYQDGIALVQATEIRYEIDSVPIVIREPLYEAELRALPFSPST